MRISICAYDLFVFEVSISGTVINSNQLTTLRSSLCKYLMYILSYVCGAIAKYCSLIPNNHMLSMIKSLIWDRCLYGMSLPVQADELKSAIKCRSLT